MTKRDDLASVRVALSDACIQIKSWRQVLAALVASLEQPGNIGAAELYARKTDAVYQLGVLRNTLDALLARIDNEERPTPVHPYAPVYEECETCPVHVKRVAQNESGD